MTTVDRQREAFLRYTALREGRSYESVVEEYQGKSATNNGLFMAVETALQHIHEDVGEISDGYHTFNELYAYRMAYNALLFNEWFKAGKNDVHWSRKHSTGEDCFGGGWFVVVAQTPSGQITNHYELKDLQWFVAIEERERAAEWDGHTPAEAFDRLRKEAWHFSIPF